MVAAQEMAEYQETIAINASPQSTCQDSSDQQSTSRAAASPVIVDKGQRTAASGHLHTLTDEQRLQLYQMWRLLFRYLSKPYEEWGDLSPARTATLLGHSTDSVVLTREHVEGNLMARELYRQSATDDLDTILLRFLRARKWRLHDAFAMLLEWMRWRREFGVEKLLCKGEAAIKKELLTSGKVFAWNEDRKGRIVCYMRGARHNRNHQTLEQSIHQMVFMLEAGRWLRRFDEQLVTAVVDLRGVTLAALELPFAKRALMYLERYFPEILGDCLIMNAPWIFWGFWAMIKGLLDPVVASKVKFIKEEELSTYIDPKCIPRDFPGGESPFEFYYPEGPDHDKGFDSKGSGLEVSSDAIRNLEEQFSRVTLEVGHALTSKGTSPPLELLNERDEIKRRMRTEYFRLLSPLYPKNMYHRWGVLDDNGHIDWNRFSPPRSPSPSPSPSDTRIATPAVSSPSSTRSGSPRSARSRSTSTSTSPDRSKRTPLSQSDHLSNAS